MFYIAILVVQICAMNSLQFKCSPDREYPAIVLDMTNFMEHLSDEYVCGKAEVVNDGAQPNPDQNAIDSKTEDSICLGEICSVSKDELEREEKVRQFDVEFVVS